ncbi:MAG: hypothetical protein WCI75_17790, partial [candidate division NC10 bacterium]
MKTAAEGAPGALRFGAGRGLGLVSAGIGGRGRSYRCGRAPGRRGSTLGASGGAGRGGGEALSAGFTASGFRTSTGGSTFGASGV